VLLLSAMLLALPCASHQPTPCVSTPISQVIREKKMMKQDLGDILGMMFGGEQTIWTRSRQRDVVFGV